MKALKITSGGTTSLIDLDEADSLSQMQAAVGGYIEILSLREDLSMVLDEEGKLKGRPCNDVAIQLTRQYAVPLQSGDFIVGDVLLIGTDSDGEEQDVPLDAVRILSELAPPLTGTGATV